MGSNPRDHWPGGHGAAESPYISVVELECENSAWVGESMVPHDPYLDSIPRQGLHVLDTAGMTERRNSVLISRHFCDS